MRTTVLMSMQVVRHVALSVFKESVRDRVLYSLVAFATLLIGASYLIGQLTAGQDVKIIKDLGLAAIAIFGLFIAVFIGIGLVWKEVERRSIYSLLSKPIRRHEFILGKYAGLALTLLVNVAMMTAAFYVVLAYMNTQASDALRAVWPAPAADPGMLRAVALIVLELLLVTAIALFFSTFSSPFLSAALTFGLWVAGHFNADLRNFEVVVESKTAAYLARGIYYVLPNFAAFDIKAQVVNALPVPPTYLLLAAAYALVYIALLLTGAVLVFSRRDFK
ncbi:MAG: ABC transporter permease subunit [Acidobacteria bacterium]|nr:ABC transporter permease subunit [Acidobacteriota bacterium]